MTHKLLSCVIALTFVLTLVAQQEGLSPKGIFQDPAATPTKNGLAYRILLIRGETRQEVPVTFSFHSGDRFKLQLNLKDSAYVYVLNRTFNGNPSDLGEKGIMVVRQEDRTHATSADTYTLLYPNTAEAARKVAAGSYRDIPADAALRMDQTPGLEKVYIVVSDHPLNLPSLFAGGHLRADAGSLGQLNADIAAWAADTQTEAPVGAASGAAATKGIDRDAYTIGPRSKPILAELTLHHLRN